MSSSEEARRILSAARELVEEDATAALTLFEQAANKAARAGDRNVQADAELGWGEALFTLNGRENESLLHLNRAIALGKHTTIEALAWLAMGDVWLFYKDADRAENAFASAATLFMGLNDVTGELIARKALAQLLQMLERDEDAFHQMRRAVKLSSVDDEPAEFAELVLSLGELLLRLRRQSEAAPVLSAAAELFQQLGEHRLEARARGHLIGIGGESPDYAQLIRLTELLLGHTIQEGDAQSEATLRYGLAQLLSEQDELEGGIDG